MSPAAAGAIGFVIAFAAVVHFGWTGAHRARLGSIAGVVALLLAVLTYGVFTHVSVDINRAFGGDATRIAYWVLLAGILLYVAGPFIQTFQRSGRLAFPYQMLFTHSWANFHIGAIGALFLGAVWVVLGLWAALFAMIGVKFFADLFSSGPFAWGISGAAVAYGVGYALERADLILTLRGVTLGVLRLLLPPVALIALAFVVSALFQGLGPLWETDHASMILLAWSILMILLLNAVYQDGSDTAPFSRPVIKLIEAAFVVLPLFSVVAVYGLSLRIHQHGLTVVRTYGMVVASFIALYCFGYAYAVLRRSSAWLTGIQPINRSIALLVLAVILLLQLPWLDPFRLSADNQFRRVADGHVPIAEFDFGYLKFELGHEGREAIDKLRIVATDPQRAALAAALAKLDRYADLYAWKLAQHQIELNLSSDEPLPAGLTESLQREAHELACAGGTCFVFPIALAPDGLATFGVLVSRVPNAIPVFALAIDGTWRRLGAFTIGESIDLTTLRAAIDADDYAAVAPATPDLRVGNHLFHFVHPGPFALAPAPNGSVLSPSPVDRNTAPAPPP